jgi:hypothetical protein
LSGTPDAGTAGSFPLTITGINGIGADATQDFTLTVHEPQAPEITSADNTTFTVGTNGTFTVTTTGVPDAAISVTGTLPEDNWSGYVGFIHKVLRDEYLSTHSAPEDCEYYICGPPMMNTAVIAMLVDLGVTRDNILLDDFGG